MVKKVSYLAALLIEVGGAHLKRRAIQYRMGTESINCDLGLPPTHPLVFLRAPPSQILCPLIITCTKLRS